MFACHTHERTLCTQARNEGLGILHIFQEQDETRREDARCTRGELNFLMYYFYVNII